MKHFTILSKIIVIIISNLLSLLAHAQPSMEILFASRDHDEVCGPITCTKEGEIFFILWKAEKPDWTFLNGRSFLYKMTENGDTLCWNYQKPDTILYYLFKLNSLGDSVLFFHNNDELKNHILSSITIPSDSSSVGLHLWGGNPPPDHSTCEYIEYDTLFRLLLSQWYLNPDFGLPYNSLNYNPTSYISCGRYWPLEKGYYPERYIKVMKMDEDLNVSDYIDLTYPDPEKPTYAAWYQCIDFINPSRIFVGGMEDKGSTMWHPNPSWVYVACLNENLDLINEEYIGGDALYETYYVKATYDGGVILTGSKYNDSIQDHERDGFLMKFDIQTSFLKNSFYCYLVKFEHSRIVTGIWIKN